MGEPAQEDENERANTAARWFFWNGIIHQDPEYDTWFDGFYRTALENFHLVYLYLTAALTC